MQREQHHPSAGGEHHQNTAFHSGDYALDNEYDYYQQLETWSFLKEEQDCEQTDFKKTRHPDFKKQEIL